MSCGCANFDGDIENPDYNESFQDFDGTFRPDAEEVPSFDYADGDTDTYEPDASYEQLKMDEAIDGDNFVDDDFDNFELEIDGEEFDEFMNAQGDEDYDVEEVEGMDDEEFDEFLTRRSRARRKLRRKLRKEGKSRKEARKEAIAKIPKQKLGRLLKYAVQFKTDPETKKLIDKGLVPAEPSLATKVIKEAVEENEKEGTQTQGDGTTTTPPPTTTQMGAGAGKGKKAIMMVLIIGVVAVGGFFAWKKFKK